jgi:hypothetical protein
MDNVEDENKNNDKFKSNIGLIVFIVIAVVVYLVVTGMATPTSDVLATSSDVQASTPASTPKAWDNIPVGHSVRCNAHDPKNAINSSLYRYLGNGQVVYYPTGDIASILDPKANDFTTIDCDGITLGPDTIGGNDTNNVATFSCPVKSGTIIWGTHPDKIVTYAVPAGTTTMQVTPTTIGSDPNVGVGKKWGSYYTC